MKKKITEIKDLSIINTDRTIIVGDIHGEFEILQKLLQKINFSNKDILICTGDLVDRGPDSLKTLLWFMQTKNAYTVLGNHDNKLMRYLMGNNVRMSGSFADSARSMEQLSELDKGRVLDWLFHLPYIIRVPNINNIPSYVVHAGIDIEYPINKQLESTCIYIRHANKKDFLDSKSPLWYDTIPETLKLPYNLFFGHIVESRVNPHHRLWALDSGACFGGPLRAAVIENNKIEIMETNR